MTKKLKALFTASIVLNVLAIGFLLGHLGRTYVPFLPPDPQEILNIVPQSQRASLQARLDAIHAAQGMRRRDVADSEQALMRILTAPSFDEEAFRDRLRVLDEIYQNTHAEMTDLMITLAKEMTVEQRTKLADHVRRAAPPR